MALDRLKFQSLSYFREEIFFFQPHDGLFLRYSKGCSLFLRMSPERVENAVAAWGTSRGYSLSLSGHRDKSRTAGNPGLFWRILEGHRCPRANHGLPFITVYCFDDDEVLEAGKEEDKRKYTFTNTHKIYVQINIVSIVNDNIFHDKELRKGFFFFHMGLQGTTIKGRKSKTRGWRNRCVKPGERKKTLKILKIRAESLGVS